jgi:hypothetical protein
MRAKIFVLWLAVLALGFTAIAQQPQPLTVWYDYTVKPGKEDGFLELVKTVGAPVRNQLMAEGVVQAWGMETPLLRNPNGSTHTIWVNVNDWAGVDKVQKAMAAQLAKLASEEAKSARKPAMTTAERSRDVFDMTKTRDWVTRDLVSGFTKNMPGPGYLPYTRYNFIKVEPGKGMEYRQAWEKYNKPVFDKLIADGVIDAYGLSVEEVRTEGSFTHFTWIGMKDLAAMDKMRSAFIADRDRRSQEERESIGDLFNSLTDGNASRQMVTISRMFHLAEPKK